MQKRQRFPVYAQGGTMKCCFFMLLSRQNERTVKCQNNTLRTAARIDNSSHEAVITEHFGGILACGERSQAAQLLTHCLITRPHQEKPPNLNWEQSIWFTTEHILMFKYRQEQRPKMTRSILSQQRLKTTPLLLSSEFCVVWHCGPSVNKMWSNGNLSPANPCLPDYVMRALCTYSHFLTRKAGETCPAVLYSQKHPQGYSQHQRWQIGSNIGMLQKQRSIILIIHILMYC